MTTMDIAIVLNPSVNIRSILWMWWLWITVDWHFFDLITIYRGDRFYLRWI